MGDKFLYIFVITVDDGDFDIEHLREALLRAGKIRGKAFIKNPQTFVVHSENDLSEILRGAGFSFQMEKFEIGAELNL